MFADAVRRHERYVSNYFSRSEPETYFAGDGARIDDDGCYWLLGRIDDVMNVSGHGCRRSSSSRRWSDTRRWPRPPRRRRRTSSQARRRSASCSANRATSRATSWRPSSARWIGEKIGKIARPKAVIIVCDLPKTRSGKIMRRLLRDIAEGEELGDTTTLRDPAVVEEIKQKADRRAPDAKDSRR